jgi:inosine/xanthosine triphosphatase
MIAMAERAGPTAENPESRNADALAILAAGRARALTIAVGSLNPVKISAARTALERAGLECELQGVAVPSGVAEQPIGLEESTHGARQRALNARAALEADWGVGMEGGVEFDSAGDAWLFNVVAIAAGKRDSLARGGQLRLPRRVAARLREGAELGPLMDELLGTTNIKQGLGAIGYLTSGLITREAAFYDSFSRALAPLLLPDLYDAL